MTPFFLPAPRLKIPGVSGCWCLKGHNKTIANLPSNSLSGPTQPDGPQCPLGRCAFSASSSRMLSQLCQNPPCPGKAGIPVSRLGMAGPSTWIVLPPDTSQPFPDFILFSAHLVPSSRRPSPTALSKTITFFVSVSCSICLVFFLLVST